MNVDINICMIAASLYFGPCTAKELITRDFLENKDREYLDPLLSFMVEYGLLYKKHEKYYVYHHFAASPAMSEFELL